MKKITIGNRVYVIEENPIGNTLVKEPLLVVYGVKHVLQLDYSSESGWKYSPQNKTYTTATVTELNGSKSFNTSTNELYKVVKTNSRRLSKRFCLELLKD